MVAGLVQAAERWARTGDRRIAIQEKAELQSRETTMAQVSTELEALKQLEQFFCYEIPNETFEKLCAHVEKKLPNQYALQLHYLKTLCINYQINGTLPPFN